MKKTHVFVVWFLSFLLAVISLTPAVWAGEEYRVTYVEREKHKALFDDPRPYLKDSPIAYKNVMSPQDYAKVTYDVGKMKQLWAEVIGFSAPDVVGKIAPEIKPGTYSYKDKEKYPGLKELMIPDLYDKFKPGEPPFVCNFPEVKIVPTRQYYWAVPIAEATKKYMGKTKLDDKGYMISASYTAGYPFPRPSGNFKAQQILYNYEKNYYMHENFFNLAQTLGISKRLKIDKQDAKEWFSIRLEGRVCVEPYGWLDERARMHRELRADLLVYDEPRDSFGNAFSMIQYSDPDKYDSFMIYVNALRRIRKMSSTDTQDAVGGTDTIYEDKQGFGQKHSPTRYPYKYKVIDEREFLVPVPPTDGSTFITSSNFEIRNLEFERRPLYVLELTQLDKNFVYSKRVLYIDKETLLLIYALNYDQKGRPYRSTHCLNVFIPEMGNFVPEKVVYHDLIDLHNSIGNYYTLPAPWVKRGHVNLKAVVRGGK